MQHSKNTATLVVAYGDDTGKGRGLYRVSVQDNRLDVQSVYQCREKPGAVTCLGKSWLLSYRDEQQQAGLRLLSSSDSGLIVELEQPFDYFISSFAHLKDHSNDSNLLLGASFYDGADLLLTVSDKIEATSVCLHPYRVRTEDPRQTACHPHHIGQLGTRPWVYSVDMGTDSVSLYALDNTTLTLDSHQAIDAPLGVGPRIMRLTPDGCIAYLLNEIDNSVTVYKLSQNPASDTPVFHQIQCLPTTLADKPNSAAGCVLSDDGRFVLVSNRGEDSIVLFRVEPETGMLTLCDRLYCARTPRDLFLHGDMLIIAAQDGNCLQLASIDPIRQTLHLLDEVTGIPQPVGFMQ